MKIAPGVTLNFSKSGISTSLGVRGAKVTVGPRGVRRTVGLPGTGLFYTETGSYGGKQASKRQPKAQPQLAPSKPVRPQRVIPQPVVTPVEKELTPEFLDSLVPDDERAFFNACEAYTEGNTSQAISELEAAIHLADGAFLAGFLAVGEKRYAEAERALKQALGNHAALGRYFEKYSLDVELALPITENLVAHIRPCRRGVLLGLAEVLQAQKKTKEALACLKKIHKDDPDDVVVKLSMVELICDAQPESKRLAKQVVELIGNVDNESSVHAALLFYKAHALRTLGLLTAAREALTSALRKTKDRGDDLLRAIRFERACVYDEMGQATRARQEYEKVYSEDPRHEDVADRLGL